MTWNERHGAFATFVDRLQGFGLFTPAAKVGRSPKRQKRRAIERGKKLSGRQWVKFRKSCVKENT